MDDNRKVVPDHFCSKPFNYVHTNNSGAWKPCCKSVEDLPTKGLTFDEWWYDNDWLNGLRNEMLTEPGPKMKHHCWMCFEPESRGTKSYRQHITEKDLAEGSVLDVVQNFKDLHYPTSLERFVYLKPKGFGNLCNLSCYMCHPAVSSTRRTEMLKTDTESMAAFGTRRKSLIRNKNLGNEDAAREMFAFARNYGHLIKTINLSGGEPTMIPGLLKILDILVETGESKGIILFMNSNLTKAAVLENQFMKYIPNFHKVIIRGSVDHIGEKDEWIRYPSKFNEVIECGKHLNSLPNVDFDINITWSILNIEDADEIIDTLESYGFEIASNTNFVNNPKMLHVSNHPDKSLIKTTRPELMSEINKPFNELLFHQACSYIKDLDRIRGTNAKELWSWIV